MIVSIDTDTQELEAENGGVIEPRIYPHQAAMLSQKIGPHLFKGTSVGYLHIDMNVAYPESAALAFFSPYLAKGAPVIVDDYGFPLHRIQKEVREQTRKSRAPRS